MIYFVPRRRSGKIKPRKQKPGVSAATRHWDRSISDGDVDAEGNCRLSAAAPQRQARKPLMGGRQSKQGEKMMGAEAQGGKSLSKRKARGGGGGK